jgi:hypothetical protein
MEQLNRNIPCQESIIGVVPPNRRPEPLNERSKPRMLSLRRQGGKTLAMHLARQNYKVALIERDPHDASGRSH